MRKLKKIFGVLAIGALSASLAVGGTLAYLQGSAAETNVMTVGNVKVELVEEQRAEDSEVGKLPAMEEFTQGKRIYPMDGSDVERDLWGMPVDSAYLDKIVNVSNTGVEDAYVRVFLAIPEVLDGGALRWDLGQNFDAKGEGDFNAIANPAAVEAEHVGTTEQEGINYNVYCITYPDVIASGESTPFPALVGAYLDKTVDIIDGEIYFNNAKIDYALEDGILLPVAAQAIQAKGFSSAEEAFTASGMPKNYWFEEEFAEPEVTLVKEKDELVAAIAEGGTVVLTQDIVMEDNTSFSVPAGKETILNMNGNEISGIATEARSTALVQVATGGSLRLTGDGTISVKALQPDTNWDPEGFPTYASNTIANSGTLIVDGVTIVNETAKGGASYAVDNYPGSHLIVNSGSIKQTGGDVAIRMFANSTTAATKVTINGGEISGRRAIWLQLPGSNSANAKMAELTVNGGELSGTQYCIYSYSYGDSFANTKVALTGGTFNGDLVFGGGYKGDTEEVIVTGGTFNGKLGRYTDAENTVWEDITLQTGGSFVNWDPTPSLSEEESVSLVLNENGDLVYTVVEVDDTASDEDGLTAALTAGDRVVVLEDDVEEPDAGASNGYGTAGFVLNGGILDGKGNTLTVEGAGGTWDCALNVKSGQVNNLTVEGAFRGIFITSSGEDVVINNCVIDNVCYTIHADTGNKNASVFVNNTTLNGWTSYSGGWKAFSFTNCKFGAGTGAYTYAYCRPYNDTTFTNCVFEEGYQIDATRANHTFVKCYVGETQITEENIQELLGVDPALVTIK